VGRLLAWVKDRLAVFHAGTLVPQDPGPMATHHHHTHDHHHATTGDREPH
jgi:urease accessory protein